MIPGAVERVFPHPGHVHLYNVFRLEFDEVDACQDNTNDQIFVSGFSVTCRILWDQENVGIREKLKLPEQIQNKQQHETDLAGTCRTCNFRCEIARRQQDLDGINSS